MGLLDLGAHDLGAFASQLLDRFLAIFDWLHGQILWWLSQSPPGTANRAYADGLMSTSAA